MAASPISACSMGTSRAPQLRPGRRSSLRANGSGNDHRCVNRHVSGNGLPQIVKRPALLVYVLLSGGQFAPAQNPIIPGKIFVERPTIHCLGFRWYVTGDDNRNAAVSVVYREKRGGKWKSAQPLFRVKEEIVATGDLQWTAPNLFAGSIFDLRPDTTHEVKLSLSDPDGGRAETNIVVKTRPVPMTKQHGRTLHARPSALRTTY